MKQLNLIITSILTTVVLSACGSSTGVTPSQNDTLNSISNSKGKEKAGFMQRALDSWLKDDWTPKVEQNEEIRSKYMEKVEKEVPHKVSATEITTKEQLQENTPEKLSQKDSAQTTETTYVEKKEKYPTLQEYLDKADAYFEAQERDLSNSNVEKMKKMPVIGE